MKFAIGLAAALAMAVLPATSVMAQGRDKAPAGDLGKQRERGMKEAPALVATKGYACTVTDAIFLGASPVTDEKGKAVKGQVDNIYEVSCSDGPGFMFGDTRLEPFDCLKQQTVIDAAKAKGEKASVPGCKLPANADPKAGMAQVLQKVGITCTVDKARWGGSSPSQKFDQYEVGCADGQSHLIRIPQPGSAEKLASTNCFELPAQASDSCEYFQKSAGVAMVAALASKAGKACTVSDARWVGKKTNGGAYLEAACSDGKTGFMIETDAKGAYVRNIECGRADNIGGGCTLTASAVAGETTDAPLYAKKAKEIGFDCAVSKYRGMGLEPGGGRENVEVACSDRQDGAFLLIPVKGDQKGELYDCVRAEARSQSCKLSDKKAAFARVAQRITAKGASCNIKATRGIGQTPDGQDVIEFACEGGPGMIAVYEKGFQNIAQIVPCDKAASLAGGCKLQ